MMQLPELAPRTLLVLDATGALLTSLITGLLFATAIVDTGLPIATLWIMAGIAAVYALVGLYSYAFVPNVRRALLFLVSLNLAYCLLTASIWAWHFRGLTVVGYCYFPLELVVILLLAGWEWRVAEHVD